ncbi:hypothetical protein MNBD_GAMMA15-947 [hydrothermal vent metagenome]|uniref:Uncharacterized protein n=1 Tax=hydrothermal vent metagenome TaxID=652676 RepID=A0A3B0YGU0_9ZZZZ
MKRWLLLIVLLLLAGFLTWRFIRPMNIFVVDDRFAWPVDTTQVPPVLGKLSAGECAVCHQAFYDEWRTTIHSQAWTDPYFQTDWQFDNSQHICRLCHTPLDRQQPHKVLGYRDKDKWDPVLKDNPNFDPGLQHEGVTCAACHYRDGKIVGVLGDTNAPHPVKKLVSPNEVCVRCHIVEGDRWDAFFRFPPCGTVAEITSTKHESLSPEALQQLTRLLTPEKLSEMGQKETHKETSGETTEPDIASLGCVECHMPLVKRPLVEGGVARNTRHHYWRGGHDPEMIRKALTVAFTETTPQGQESRLFQLTLANTGAAHYVPTGTPDRYLTVHLRLLDDQNKVLDETQYTIKRTVMWRPFIVDLWDTRLPRWQPRQYQLEVPGNSEAVKVEAEIRYHLLAESRRKRIGYENTTPINYEVFRQQIPLDDSIKEGGL